MQGSYGAEQLPILYYAVYAFAQLGMIILPILIILLAAKWIYSLIVVATSTDGGRSWREEQRRRARERFALGAAIACFAAGIVLALAGFGEGTMTIKLLGIEVTNAGFAVVLIGAMLLIIWMLLRAPESAMTTSPAELTVVAEQDRTFASGGMVPAPVLVNMTYLKAGLISLALLLIPGIGPLLAIAVGTPLFFKAAANARSQH